MAVAKALLTWDVVRTVEGSSEVVGEGEEKWRLSKMARDMALLSVQLSIVSHFWRYSPLGREWARSLR